jgi:hypothetical protein
VATAGSAGGWTGVWVVVRSDVETWEEGAAAIMEGDVVCWPVSELTPDAGAVAAMGVCPVAFTGAESVAKELGDPMTL